MTGWIEDEALRFEGLDEADIATVNARLPDLLNLIAVTRAHQAQLDRVLTDLLPILQKIIAKQQELKS